jgi:alcohol dehydrogenase class IV
MQGGGAGGRPVAIVYDVDLTLDLPPDVTAGTAMNALCLPPALAFNRALVPAEVERFGDAIGGDAVERARELALLGGFERLRDFGVPEEDLPDIAAAAAERPGNKANPRPATSEEIVYLLTRIY